MPHINFKNYSSLFLGIALAVLSSFPQSAYAVTVAHPCPGGGYSYSACPPRQNTANTGPSANANTLGPGASTQTLGPSGTANGPTSYGPGLSFPSGLGGNSESLQNPLKFNSFPEFFTGLLHIIVIFAIPIIILMIIYAGFLYVMARGSEEQVTKASRALTYAVLGGLIILGAELILQVIQGTVSQLTP